jgi:ATP-binding cassette subfamily B protein
VQFYVMQWVGQRIVLELRRRILAHLQSQELAYYDRNPVGRLMTRVMGDVQALHELFTSGVVAIFGDFVTLVGIVVAMFLLDWRLALVANLVLPALIAISLLFRARVRRSYAEIRTWVAAMNAFLQEHLTGMRVVQLFGRETATSARFAALNGAHRDVQLRTVGYYALFFPAIEFVSAVALALILAAGGRRVGSEGLQLGLLIAFMQYAERFFRPISDLSEKYNTFQAAMASAERIFGLLDRTATIRSPAQPIRLHRARGHIVFEHVDFAYDPREPVLHDVSFEVRPGEKLAIVGATGAGKTSILSVLTRLYEIQSGRVLLDGVDIRELELQGLRRQVGVVLQDVFLFAGDIAGNIRLGDTSIGIERLREAARLAGASAITRLPRATTPRWANGSSISVGEVTPGAGACSPSIRPVVLDERPRASIFKPNS